MSFKLLIQSGILIRHAVLTGQECAHAVAAMRTSPSDPAAIYAHAADTVDDRIRRSRSVEPPAALHASVDELFVGLRPELERHFDIPLRGHEIPHYLLYNAGDFFAAHRDRPSSDASDLATRRVSVVIFLNDDFRGGELRFFGLLDGPPWDAIGFPCPAEAGLLVAFRSDVLHEVAPVTSGVRGTIATWFF